MIEIQTNLCNECMSTVLMLTLLDPTLAYYTWVKTREPWEYDYSIAFHTKLRHNISYTSITIIMKSISQQTQNDIISVMVWPLLLPFSSPFPFLPLPPPSIHLQPCCRQ